MSKTTTTTTGGAFHGGVRNPNPASRTRPAVLCKNCAAIGRGRRDDPSNCNCNCDGDGGDGDPTTVLGPIPDAPPRLHHAAGSASCGRRIHHQHASSSLPSLGHEHNAKNLVTKFGFVVTRSTSRGRSLDAGAEVDRSIFHNRSTVDRSPLLLQVESDHCIDHHSVIEDEQSTDSRPSGFHTMLRGGPKFQSRDDSVLPLLMQSVSTSDLKQLRKDLLSSSAAAAAKLSKLRRDLSDRSQSFDCRHLDIFASNSKFLTLEDDPSASAAAAAAAAARNCTSPFKAPASVPFMWEIAPGLPKPEASKPDPTLRLPPRLLVRSFTTRPPGAGGGPNLASERRRRASSVNNRQGSMLLGFHSSSSSSSSSPNTASASAAAASDGLGKAVDPSSPTSVFGGPSSSQCSSSECCDSDSRAIVLVSDAESGTAAAAAAASDHRQGEQKQSSDLGPPKASLRDSIARILKKGRSKLKRKNKRSGDVQMWAPTLAAYFTIEASYSGQLALSEHEHEVKSAHESGSEEEEHVKSEGSSKVAGDEDEDVPGEESVESNEFIVAPGLTDTASCGCASPRFTPFSPHLRSSLKRIGSGRQQRKWVVSRIRKSSRVLSFVFNAVHARSKA